MQHRVYSIIYILYKLEYSGHVKINMIFLSFRKFTKIIKIVGNDYFVKFEGHKKKINGN